MARRSKAKPRLTPAQLSAFCAQTALMLGAGMILSDGLAALRDSDRENSELYASLSEAVSRTGSLYEALREDPRWPKYLTEMTGVGERAGRLEEVMQGLAAYYDREGRIRSAVARAAAYPVALGVMMLLIVLVMIIKVLPVFRRVLDSMGVAMTASGSLMMEIGAGVGWAVLAIVGLGVLAALVCIAAYLSPFRPKMLNLMCKFPPVKRLTVKLSASRVASVLSMMLQSGFPLEEALSMAANTLSDAGACAEMQRMRRRLDEGASFADAISRNELFDLADRRMLVMAIAAGREDQVMAKVAQGCEEQVEDGVAGWVSVIEPTLVALLSVVIGAILLSVMLPMAGVLSSIL